MTSFYRWEIIGGVQYLYSETGKLVEELEDTKVFLIEIDLKSSSHERIVLRLPPSCKSCWIYGVFVTKNAKPRRSLQHFNIENINSMLSDKPKLSGDAEKFKHLFDAFQSSGSSKDSIVASGLSIMGHQSSDVNDVASKSQSDMTFMKFYIDKKFSELESTILRKIKESEERQQEKLDQILALLNHAK